MRGNVDTRLRKLEEGQFDAIVLARAGLVRLGLEGRATEVLPAEVSLPAVGQGALGIECREDDAGTRARLAPLHHAETATCVAAERGVLVALGGDCKTPLGAYAEKVGATLRLRAFVASGDGKTMRRVERTAPWPMAAEEAHALGLAAGRTLV
jgi:hydroxymethylbilane synthase